MGRICIRNKKSKNIQEKCKGFMEYMKEARQKGHDAKMTCKN